jgi:hypothetical protein
MRFLVRHALFFLLFLLFFCYVELEMVGENPPFRSFYRSIN